MTDATQELGKASNKRETILNISLYLMSEEGGAELAMQYGPAGVEAVQELLGLFGDAEGASFSLNPVQIASASLKTALDALVMRHARITPHLHRLNKFIADLPDDTHFLLLPAQPESTSDRLECERFVHRLNHPDDASDQSGVDNHFRLLLEHYDIDNPRTDRLTSIGTSAKAERRCRFCHRTTAEGATFKSVAHAIPTALGNDHLKLNEECDECNGYFGRETEPSLIAMLDIPRAFLGTQGRGKNGGRPELRFEDGKLQHDGQKMNVESRNIDRDDSTGRLTINLGKGPPIIPIAVYRALVKIAISVVDAKSLPSLVETTKWVRYGAHSGCYLPKVMTALVGLPPNPSAQIVVYRRKKTHLRLPHLVGEFRLGCFIYVFAVPFSTEDTWNLEDFFEDADFRETFKHYAAVERWTPRDLSSPTKVLLAPKLQIVPETRPEV